MDCNPYCDCCIDRERDITTFCYHMNNFGRSRSLHFPYIISEVEFTCKGYYNCLLELARHHLAIETVKPFCQPVSVSDRQWVDSFSVDYHHREGQTSYSVNINIRCSKIYCSKCIGNHQK